MMKIDKQDLKLRLEVFFLRDKVVFKRYSVYLDLGPTQKASK